jgi:hypothetical protein
MKVDDAIETLTKFFNDLIGSLVPSVVLAFGLVIMHLGPSRFMDINKSVESTIFALFALGLMFAAGHIILALHEHFLRPVLQSIQFTKEFDESAAKNRQSYKSFHDIIMARETRSTNPGQAAPKWDYHDLRSVALSISPEGASVGRRFMFISLLCNGVGTAFVIMVLDFSSCFFFAPKLLYPYTEAASWWVQIILMLAFSAALFKQGGNFHARAMSTPFSIAIAELLLKRDPNATQKP